MQSLEQRRPDMLPTFVGLGSQRSASTWLHSVLKAHPQITMTSRKEVAYFGKQIQWHNLNWYTDLFRDPSGLPTRAIRGDISPWYSRLRRHSVESLRRIIPDLKAVLIIRNPIARSWSQAMVELSFMKDVPADHVPIGRILRHVVRRRTNRYNDYQPVIELWDDVFGAGCVHVDIFDKVKTDPNGLLRGILKHVGADPDLRVPDEVLKEQVGSTEKAIKGVKVEMPEFMRWLLATQWLEPTRRLNAKLDGMVDSWVKEMEEIAGKRVPGSWKLRRFAYRQLLSLPERLAYEVYEAQRELRLRRRNRVIEEQARNAPR
jgi:hypothetical protein